MKRDIIEIDEELCNGCGACIPNCAEGALQIIDGKARLLSDLFCDGLGACLGHCPLDAIRVIRRDAVPYDEVKTMRDNIVKAGANTIKSHLNHLEDHGETEYLKQAINFLKENNIPNPLEKKEKKMSGCPGTQAISFEKPQQSLNSSSEKRVSQLSHWPV